MIENINNIISVLFKIIGLGVLLAVAISLIFIFFIVLKSLYYEMTEKYMKIIEGPPGQTGPAGMNGKDGKGCNNCMNYKRRVEIADIKAEFPNEHEFRKAIKREHDAIKDYDIVECVDCGCRFFRHKNVKEIDRHFYRCLECAGKEKRK